MLYSYINSKNKEEINKKIKILDEKGIVKNNIFIENNNIKKIRFKELLNKIQEFDTLIILDITELSTIEQLCNLIEFSAQNKIKLMLETLILDCTNIEENSKVQGMIEMAVTVLSFKKKMLQGFIKRGVYQAERKGKKIGRPRLTLEALPELVKQLYPLYESGNMTATEFAKKCNMSRPRILRYIKFIEAEREIGNEKNI